MFTESAKMAVKEKIEQRKVRARRLIDDRREEVYNKIPEIKQIDTEIAKTGSSLVRIALGNNSDGELSVDEIKKQCSELVLKKGELLIKNGFTKDYMENVYICSVCNDTGFCDGEMCSCMKSEMIKQAYEETNVATAIKNVCFDDINFAYYTGDALEQARFVFEKCRNFAQNFDMLQTKSLLIFGATGVGKTFFSAATANELLKKGKNVLYFSAQKLFSSLVDARFGGKTPDDVYDCDLLIIDDLGTEIINTATTSCFFELLNSRMLENKKMIINTNLNFKNIEEIYSSRILSRFMEFERLALTGEDIRIKKNK